MRLTLRADADAAIGAGHVARCAALGQAAQAAGHEALLVTGAIPADLSARLDALGVERHELSAPGGSLEEARETLAVAAPRSDWILVDGYHFGLDYQAALVAGGGRLLILDDHAAQRHYQGSALLNPAGEQLASTYQRIAPHCELLLGPRYALLRSEFTQAHDDSPTPSPPAGSGRQRPSLLITMGAADPKGMSTVALDAIDRIAEPLSARLIVGPLNPSHEELRRRIAGSHHDLELIASPESMRCHMLWADLALSAAGGTCWELACLGTPAVVVPIVDNQRWVARTLSAAGAAVELGAAAELTTARLAETLSGLLADAPARARMSSRARSLVDGRGCERVLKYCLERLEG